MLQRVRVYAGFARHPLGSLAAAVVIWATVAVVGEAALRSCSPAVLTVLRFSLSGLVLLPLALARPAALREVVTSRAGALLGLTGVSLSYAFQLIGLDWSTAGTLALLQALNPVVIAIMAALVLDEPLRRHAASGLVLATLGAALVATDGARVDAGSVMIILGITCYAAYMVGLRLLADRPAFLDPVAVAAGTTVWGLAFLMPWLGWEVATGAARWPDGPRTVVEVVYLGVIATALIQVMWAYGAARTEATVSGIFLAGIPALGYAFAVLAGESPTWSKSVGGLLAVLGIVIAGARRARPPA